MMYSALLAIHIVGACATGIVAASAGAALWRQYGADYRGHAIALGFLAGFEIFSGVALSVASIDVTALSLCKNLAIYLLIVCSVEALLCMRMRKIATVFPAQLAFSPVAASLVLMLAAISYGF